MNKIFCIVGKSASGKDTIYKKIVSAYKDELTGVVLGTTRPKRTGETDGVDYKLPILQQEKSNFIESEVK